MKALVFDSGPLITFALNSVLHALPFLRKEYGGSFYVCNAVHKEVIETPSHSKKFSLEAMQVQHLITQGHLELYDTSEYAQETHIITELTNSIYSINGKNLTILNAGELDALVLAKNINAEAVVVDERTTRLILENPFRLQKLLEKKFGGKVAINRAKLHEFERHFSPLKIIRSVELALIAVEKGFFDHLIHEHSRSSLVYSLLWALKLNGCAVSEREIAILVKMYK
ncbi:MAG: hypothetical protein ACMXYE_02910 [Candidatus Woesearchaeota archaeon]